MSSPWAKSASKNSAKAFWLQAHQVRDFGGNLNPTTFDGLPLYCDSGIIKETIDLGLKFPNRACENDRNLTGTVTTARLIFGKLFLLKILFVVYFFCLIYRAEMMDDLRQKSNVICNHRTS